MNAPEPYQRLADNALKKIRELCRGNGIKRDKVTLAKFESQSVEFYATTHLDVKPQIEEKHIQGQRNDGQVLRSAEEVRTTVQNLIEATKKDPELRERISKALLDRSDKGFGLNKKVIGLPFLSQEYVWHEECRDCRGTGHIECGACHGSGRVQCPQCHGHKMMTCDMCHGSGQIQGSNGPQTCPRCHGHRQIPCSMCHQTGYITCRQCGGKGHMSCGSCAGTGSFSHITYMNMNAETHFGYERDRIPPDMRNFFDSHPTELAQKGDIKISPELADNETAMHYRVTFPHGDITFLLGKKALSARLFGYKGRLTSVPYFIEKLVGKGILNLEQAARATGSVPTKIKESSRYRLLGFALLNVSQNSERKTYQALKKKYPYGISDKALQKITKLADQALGHITLKPRYIGLGIGIILTGLLYSAYYIGPLRNIISPFINSSLLSGVIDLLMIFIGATITTLSIQITASRAMQNALGHLMPAHKRKSLIPKAGSVSYLGYIGGLVIYLILVELTVHMHTQTPEWYSYLRNLIN